MSFAETVNFVETCLYVPITTVGVALNILVMKTAMRQCEKRRSDDEKVNNYFIFNLAVADLCVLSLVIPLQLMELNVSVWPFSEFFCCFMHSITNSVSYVSVLSIAALSLHRNWLLIRPSWLGYLNSSNAKCLIVILWWFSYVAIGLPFAFVMKVKYDTNSTSTCEPVWPSKKSMKIHIAYMMSLVVIPLFLTTCSYYRIRQVFRKFVASDAGASYVARSYANDFLVKLRKFARLLNVIVCGFWICYAPYVAMALFITYSTKKIPIDGLENVLICGARVMLYFNPVVNPLVLVIFSKPYRKGVVCLRRLRRGMTIQKTVVSLQIRSKVQPNPPESAV